MGNISLRSTFLNGFLWTALQTIGTKIISLGAQLLLAWLLLPEDFGKVSIALSITSIVFIIQNFGLSDVLVSRGKMFTTVYHVAKSLSSLVAIICLVITVIAAFLGGYIYDDNDITNLILVFCLAIPFNTLSVVPDAKLRIDLKFKQLSIIRVTEFLISQTTIICFVFLGFGIYSFVLGPVISAFVRYIWLTKAANCSHFFSFTLHHYMYLFGNSVYGFFHSLFQTIIRQSDYLILALFVSKTAVGIYFMAYSLSVQVIGLLVNSLSPMLFPSLMKIPVNEEAKIKTVLLKILLFFSMFGMPFAIWQAAISESLVSIFFSDNWHDTILLVQILSIGIGFNVISVLWPMALRIKSEYKIQAIYSFISAVFFLFLITPFSYYLGNKGLAIAVSLYYIISSPLLLCFSLKNYQIQKIEVFKPIIKYFLLSVLVFGAYYYLSSSKHLDSLIKILVNGILAPLTYILILYFLDNDFKLFLSELKISKFKKK